MLNLAAIMKFDPGAIGLVNRNGIWYAKSTAYVSYPDDGNDSCYQIEEQSFWFRHRNNCIVELVKKHHTSGTFFDIGGGNGFVARALQDAGYDTVLVEPGEKGCENARKRKLDTVICSTVEDAGLAENSLPAIGVFDVVEHFDDDKKLLTTLNRFLAPGGHLFLTVPAYEMLWSVDDDHAGHYHRYTLPKMEKLLNSAGFSVVFDTYIFSVLPLPVFLFRSLPSKMGIRKEPNYKTNKPSEHTRESGVMTRIWNWEVEKLRKGNRIPFGGSCLVVARKA